MNFVSGLGRVAFVCGWLTLSASACLEPNPEHDGLDGGSASEGSGTTQGVDSGGTLDSGAEGMDASADGSTSSSSTSGGDGDGDGTGNPVTSGGDGTESLWHYNDLDECQLPLWCFNAQQGPLSPAGGELWAFECFETGLTPPVTLYKFAYEVVAKASQLQDFQLQARAYDPATGPGAVLNARSLDAAIYGTVDSHAIDVGWTLDTADFCIGFHAPAGGLQSALGLAVDETATVPDVSWFRVDDGSDQACGMSQMEDVIDNQPTPAGNWCFAVAVSHADMP